MKKNTLGKINGDFRNKDIISLTQFDQSSLKKLFHTTQKIKKKTDPKKFLNVLSGKIISLLFFEPSSRTFSSFCVAAKKLGGLTIEYQNPKDTSSVVKGETMEDTIKVFESYSDMIIIRHPEIGMAEKAAKAAFFVPIINAGDGSNEHPTQALLDLYTVYEHFGSLKGLTGLIVGDLLFGRTVHSLLKGFSLYSGNTIYLLSPRTLRLPRDLYSQIKAMGVNLIEIDDEREISKNCNFWYWTRIQKERFSNVREYEKVKNKLIITPSLLKEKGNRNLIIMHPLPRVGEIDNRIDKDPRAIYLRDQIKNGVYTRMALLTLVLGKN